jgi:hypothetical protein
MGRAKREMEMSQQRKQVSAKDAAKVLLLMHSGFFSDKSFLEMTDLCRIGFPNEEERVKALWEWLCFGLYVIVEGIQDNNRSSETIGMATAHELFSEFFSHLMRAGLESAELAVREGEIRQRFDQYNAVVRTGALERVGFAVAALVLGIGVSPGKIPEAVEAYELGICVNQTHIACLKVVNEFFGEYSVIA